MWDNVLFLTKKALTPFLLPPGIFIIILLVVGLWLLAKKSARAGLVTLFIALIMWALSILPVTDFLYRGLEKDFSIPDNPKGDVIILLGGGIVEGVPDMSGTSMPSDEMMGRMITAVRLQRKLNVPVIISGGRIFNATAEAPVIKRIMVDLGVPQNKLIIEDQSMDTIQNAAYTRSLALKSGYTRPILITSASHMRRAVLSFEKQGMKVTPFPSNFRAWPERKYGWYSYLPDIGSLFRSTVALKEYIGILFYQIAY